MSDVVKKQAKAVCEEISEKNGWVTFSLNVGTQYPLRLSTKLEALVTAGRAAGQQEAVWTYAESEGGDNPNRPGTKYINRRLEKVEVGGVLDPALASTSGSTGSRASDGGTAGGRSGDERVSIERQSIVKAVMASTWDFTDENMLFAFLDRMDKWIATPRAGAEKAPEPTPPATPPAAPVSDSPPHDDDDIPF